MTTEADKAIKARANLERTVGEALLFLGRHPFYEQMFLEEIIERILPPIFLRQHRIVRDKDGNAIGYVSWALTNQKIRQGLLAGDKIKKEDWQSGKDVTMIDVIAPTLESEQQLREKIKKEVFSKKSIMWLHTYADGAREWVSF